MKKKSVCQREHRPASVPGRGGGGGVDIRVRLNVGN